MRLITPDGRDAEGYLHIVDRSKACSSPAVSIVNSIA
jgi:hypothetical protein